MLFTALSKTMHGMPIESWWLAPVVLFLLGMLAVYDAVTAKVPDPLVLPSLLFVTAVAGYYVNWSFAGWKLLTAFIVGFTLFLINEIWFRVGKHDALGMGDAKWTMLAVACFGVAPAAFAWGTGAWLAIIWIGGSNLIGRRVKRVHFAPFLFVGLLAGLYWLRLH